MLFKKFFVILIGGIIIYGGFFLSTLLEITKSLNYQQIKNIYTSGCVKEQNFKVGVEYERLPLKIDDNISAGYYGLYGICNLLRDFAKLENWDYILDGKEIIGLKQGHNTITLEPGCQIEYSIEPVKSLDSIKSKLYNLDNLFSPILDEFGIKFVNYGVSPVATFKNISLIPKKRYHVMANYMSGFLADVMMRETAGIQGTFDFESEEDAIYKFKIANMLSPFMTAMFANSPIRGGVDTGYKSFRALSWLNTDNDRCGFFYNFKGDFSFDDYIGDILDVPMMFINREDRPINIDGKINFREFMVSTFKNNQATLEDYLLQANLCFPEVRLRNFIEVRNHDCGSLDAVMAILAIYKGILYNKIAKEDIEQLLKNLDKNDFEELRYSVPKSAIATKIGKYSVFDYAKEIVDIAQASLMKNGQGEEKYLAYIKNYLSDGLCPADVIIQNWEGIWNKDITKFINFITK